MSDAPQTAAEIRTVEPPSNQALLAAIVESSDDAIVSKGLDSVITSWNRAAERMFGHTTAEAVGRSVTMIIPRERLAEETQILSRIVRGEKVEHFETERMTKDGRLIPVSLTISPVLGTNGQVIGASKVARDISERRAAETQQRILTGELDHRVKNMLAVVTAIAGQTREHSSTLDEFHKAFEARLRGLARAHGLLSRTRWRGSTMREITEQIVLPMCSGTEQCKLGGCDAILSPNQAIGIAMVLQELTTNALKHGALRSRDGTLHFRWTVTGPADARVLEATWLETGGGPMTPSTRKGYGTQLLELIIAGDLRGSVRTELRPEGLECTMSFPLEPVPPHVTEKGGA